MICSNMCKNFSFFHFSLDVGEAGVEPDDLQRSLPNSTNLWFSEG